MLDFTLLEPSPQMLQKFNKHSKIYGITFLILGLLGIFFPILMSISSAIFFGWLLLFSGFLVATHTWQINKRDWLGWLKTILFSVTGAMIIINPLPGIIALGIIFAIYFIVDAFSNITLAFKIRPAKNWWIALLNGILSSGLAIIFLSAIKYPLQTIWLVGIMVGISLFFDGVMLLGLSNSMDNRD